MDTIRAAEKLPDGSVRLTIETITEIIVPPPDATSKSTDERKTAILTSAREVLSDARKADGIKAEDGLGGADPGKR